MMIPVMQESSQKLTFLKGLKSSRLTRTVSSVRVSALCPDSLFQNDPASIVKNQKQLPIFL